VITRVRSGNDNPRPVGVHRPIGRCARIAGTEGAVHPVGSAASIFAVLLRLVIRHDVQAADRDIGIM
jgi:hypothetical protein